MLVPFSILPGYARVWVFQCTEPLNENQIISLQKAMSEFCKSWQSHGKELEAGFIVSKGHFLIIGVNEDNKDASGCSIDKLFQYLKAWQIEQNLDFFDRESIGILKGEQIHFEPLKTIKNQLAEGIITYNQLIINILVDDKEKFEKHFYIPIIESWIKEVYPKVFM